MDKYLIHPDMLEQLWRFYASSCTIREATVSQDGFGEETLAFANKDGHVGLPCAIATTAGGERKTGEMNPEFFGYHVSIAGYYPDITPKMRAVVDGLELDILYVEVDSHDKTTRLMCQRVV